MGKTMSVKVNGERCSVKYFGMFAPRRESVLINTVVVSEAYDS